MLKPIIKTKRQENKPLKKRLEGVGRIAKNSPIIKVGYPLTERGGMNYPDRNVPVASVAFWQEFGTKNIPARPFFRPTLIRNNKKYRKLLADNVKSSYAGKSDLLKGMKIIGSIAVSDIQKAITNIDNPPNKPATIKRKKSSNPLIDTGFMRSSTTYEISDKRSGK